MKYATSIDFLSWMIRLLYAELFDSISPITEHLSKLKSVLSNPAIALPTKFM